MRQNARARTGPCEPQSRPRTYSAPSSLKSMGLLDDAIREHLELKRRRGADPNEIERLEQEALGPVRRGPREAYEEQLPDEPEPAYLDEDAVGAYAESHEEPPFIDD